VGALFVLLLSQVLHTHSAAAATAHAGLAFGAGMTARRKTISVEEISQILRNEKANYHGDDRAAFGSEIDAFVESLRSQYGEQVPALEAVKLVNNFQRHASERASASRTTEVPRQQAPPRAATSSPAGKSMPEGVSYESRPDGFELRASCRSLFVGLLFLVLAGALGAIPFFVWRDMIQGVWTHEYQGATFWMASAFLSAWTGGVLYAASMGAIGLFGEIRIAKTGDSGEVFTGIGWVGRTHRVLWSDYYGAGDREVGSASLRSTHTTHYVGLNGRTKGYRFGSELNAAQQAFVIAFLRKQVFGLPDLPAGSATADEDVPLSAATGAQGTTSLQHIRRALERSKANYYGSDPEGFSRRADEILESLQAQYGEQVPVADAIEHLKKFGHEPGAQFEISF